MKTVTRGMVVCCPKCGTVANITEIGIGRYACKNCKAKFGSWVVNGFVVTFEDNGDENYLAKFDECRLKLQQLNEIKIK